MTPRLLWIALALFTSSVMEGYDRSDLVRGLCEPSGCDEFKILATEKMLADDEGALFRTRIKTFRASSAGRTDVGEENGYVYCSRAKPAIMAEQDGKTMAFMIAPFATEVAAKRFVRTRTL